MPKRHFKLQPTMLLWFSIMLSSTASLCQSFLDDDSELGYKMKIIRAAQDDIEIQWDRLNPLEKSLSYLKRAIPLYSWITLCTAVETDDRHFFMGECLDSQTRFLLRFPRNQFRSEYLSVLNQLWLENPLDALTFSAAMKGQSSNDVMLSNLSPFLPIAVSIWLAFGVRRILRDKTQSISLALNSYFRRNNAKIKSAFWVTVALWLVFSVILRIAVVENPFSKTLLNLGTINLLLFGIPALVLGLFLGGRWALSVVRSSASTVAKRGMRSVNFPRKRWEALVKYDEDISAAATELSGFGDEWVDRLGEDYFALNEDKQYLSRIVARLREEAKNRKIN